MNTLPYMQSNISKKQKTISSFSGINLTLSKSNNELSESVNRSAKDFPCLSVREKRSIKSDTKTDVTFIGSKKRHLLYGLHGRLSRHALCYIRRKPSKAY